jgi:hypothetical protein
VSQRAILFILVQLLFQFSSVKRLSLDLWNEIFDDVAGCPSYNTFILMGECWFFLSDQHSPIIKKN